MRNYFLHKLLLRFVGQVHLKIHVSIAVLNGNDNNSGVGDGDGDNDGDLHDSSALVVNGGKVVPAAGSDGSQDGWVL